MPTRAVNTAPAILNRIKKFTRRRGKIIWYDRLRDPE
jgi:hypothetical protein